MFERMVDEKNSFINLGLTALVGQRLLIGMGCIIDTSNMNPIQYCGTSPAGPRIRHTRHTRAHI